MTGSPLAAPPDTDFSGVWSAVIRGLEEGVVLLDRQGHILTGNPAAEQILGLSVPQLQAQGLADPRWQVVGEDGSVFKNEYHPVSLCLQSGRAETAVMGVRHSAGHLRWLQVKAQPIKQHGVVTHVVASFGDVTEQRETQRRLEREVCFRGTLLRVVTDSLAQGLDERFYQQLLEGVAEAVPNVQAASLLLLADGRYEFAAAVNYDLVALRQAYLLPEEMYRGDDAFNLVLVHGYDNSHVAEDRRSVIDRVGRAAEIKICVSIPVLLNGQPVAYFSLDNFETEDAFGDEALGMARIFAQQTAALWQRFKLEADMKRLAFYDPLTGLPNRSLLYDRLHQAVVRCGRGGRPLAVMFIDLDNFKHVNDTYGHDVGDALLQTVAGRLGGVIREGDTLARWGGDEFVLLTELAGPEDAAALAGKLLKALEDPLAVGGRELRAQGSVGIDVLWREPKSVEALVKHADTALNRAKAAGKNTYQFFTQAMNRRVQARHGLERDLREALRQGALTLDYQPRFDLTTGAVTGVEALARWTHPVRGPVSPGEFIPVAEETGLIIPLGQQVLDLAVKQAKAWQDAGSPTRVAVNVSAAQLALPGFVADVTETLARHALDPHLLELEITESAAMACVEATVTKLGELRGVGIRVALDDFGTAYSSLTHLKRLPLDVLKLDQAFVRDLTGGLEGRDARLVRAMIELGQSFGLTVVAEGVETYAQQTLLRALDCDEAQGYLLARPQPAAGLESGGTLLAKR